MRISIVLPLFDRQHLGWASLESALDQDIARGDYEIIAVVPSDCHDVFGEGERLLARCDRVVRTERSARPIENRLSIYVAGAEQASGDLLFFMEGHTVLKRDCCRTILAHFDAHPECQVAWAPRINASLSPVGRLFDLVYMQDERKRGGRGTINLGAQNAIRRSLLPEVRNAARAYGAVGEVMLNDRLRADRIAIDVIGEPLAHHYNDYALGRLMGCAGPNGKAYFDHFDSPAATALGLMGRKRSVLRLAKHRWIAAPLSHIAREIGEGVLRFATAIFARSGIPTVGLWNVGWRLTVLAGFCQASHCRHRPPGKGTAELASCE